VEENCPKWWTDTGIRFQSVNDAPGKYNETCWSYTSFYMNIIQIVWILLREAFHI